MSLLVDLVSYTGNGSGQTIATAFVPRVIIIKGRHANHAVIKTDTMTGDSTAFLGGAVANFTGGVTSVPTGNSFDVGSDAKVNSNGIVFDALVLGGDSTVLTTGTYTGNNTADRSIAAGLTPVMVIDKADGSTGAQLRHTGHPTNTSSRLDAGVVITDGIRNFSGTNFTVSQGGANTNLRVYHWFALPTDVSNFLITFTGDANNPRNITGAGFTPDFSLIKASDTNQGGLRTTASANTYAIMNAGTIANAITALISDGVTVNSQFNASAVAHYGFAMVEHLSNDIPAGLLISNTVPGMRRWQPGWRG